MLCFEVGLVVDSLEEGVHEIRRLLLQKHVQLFEAGLAQLLFRFVLLDESHDVLGQGFRIRLASVAAAATAAAGKEGTGKLGRQVQAGKHGQRESSCSSSRHTYSGLRSWTSQPRRQSGSSISIRMASRGMATRGVQTRR